MVKLTVPDFNKINKHYETLKKDHAGKKKSSPNRRTQKMAYSGLDYGEDIDGIHLDGDLTDPFTFR